MLRAWALRHPHAAWSVGLLVLISLGIGTGAMIARNRRLPVAPAVPSPPPLPAAGLAPLPADVPMAGAAAVDGVRGTVRLPNGEPAPGATIVLYRARTAWPEWERDTLDQVATGRDGAFQFAVRRGPGLLIGYQHPALAGGLQEVPMTGEALALRLEPASALSGIVTKDNGAPIANARIALETLPGEQRPVTVAVSGIDGRYSFANLRAGAVRLVVRHEAFQPLAVPLLVVGETRRFDVRLERPSMPPLRGRVVSAANQAPIEGALVELVPSNQKLGLVDPIRQRTGADGGFVLSGVAFGAMWMIVRHPEHGCVLRGPTVGVVGPELQIEMPPRSEVRGRLLADAGGLWRAGDQLQVRDAAGQLAYASLAADGTFVFAVPLSPGWASLRVLTGEFVFQRSLTSDLVLRIDDARRTELAVPVATATRVRGRFVDEDGRPLAGVVAMSTKVLGSNMRSFRDRAFGGDFAGLEQILQLFGADADKDLATSAVDGTFEIHGLPPGETSIQLMLRGFGSRWVTFVVPAPGAPLQLGDVKLPRGGRLAGRVVRGDEGRSRPVAAAVVSIDGPEAKAVVLSDSRGEWFAEDLAPGLYRVRARPGGQRGTVSEVRDVEVVAGGKQDRVDLRLPGGREVRGIVTGRDGRPLAGALVSLSGQGAVAAATEGSGEFMIELPERAVELQVSLADRSRSKVVPVAAGQQRLDIALDTPPVCTLVGRVAGLPSRKRLLAGLVRCTLLDSDGETQSRWLEFADGELRWPLCPTGSVRLEIRCDGFAPFVVERDLSPNEEHQLGDVLLEPGCRLRGIVRDASGRPVGNAVVLLGEEGDLDLLDPRTRTAVDGSFELRGVSGRSQRLVAQAPGFAPTVIDLPLPEAVLSPSPFELTLVLGGAIEVVVAPALRDGALVQLRRAGRLLASSDLDDRGRAVFGNRSPGDYTVHLVGAASAATQAVRIASGDDTVSVRLP